MGTTPTRWIRNYVHGIQNLRVADASIMPTSGNTNAPSIMIGENVRAWLPAHISDDSGIRASVDLELRGGKCAIQFYEFSGNRRPLKFCLPKRVSVRARLRPSAASERS